MTITNEYIHSLARLSAHACRGWRTVAGATKSLSMKRPRNRISLNGGAGKRDFLASRAIVR